MVNEDSDLYREHPDWAIQIPGRKPVKEETSCSLIFREKKLWMLLLKSSGEMLCRRAVINLDAGLLG